MTTLGALSQAGVSDLLDIEEHRVLGETNEAIERIMGTMAGSGVKVEHFPDHMRGFTRSSTAD